MSNETTATRNRLKRSDIQENIIAGIEGMSSLTEEQVTALTALVKSEMKVGSVSETFPPKEIDGVLSYYCSRSAKYFPLDEMVTTKDGESKGYSKASQDKLTEVNREIKAMGAEVQNLILAGKTDEAVEKAQELNALTTAKESGEIYADL